MKKINTLLFFILSITSFGQVNLVPNPSFEEKTRCPEGYPDLDGVCNDWISFRGSPDYFHNCSSMNGYNNNWGYQEPHFGEAYAGIITFAKTGAIPPLTREYIGSQLSTPLIIGEKYYVNFYVSAAWDDISMNIASNNIGVLFTTNSFSDPLSTHSINNFAHVYTNEIITDTVNWTKISGSFVADSAYRYVVIGNFFDDFHTDTINFPIRQGVPTNQAGLYYIDDVSVVCIDCPLGISETSIDSKISVFPNPSSDYLNISFNDIEIERFTIFNSVGVLVFVQEQTTNENFFQIDVSEYNSGIYFLKIETKTAYTTKQFLITK